MLGSLSPEAYKDHASMYWRAISPAAATLQKQQMPAPDALPKETRQPGCLQTNRMLRPSVNLKDSQYVLVSCFAVLAAKLIGSPHLRL